MKKIIYTIILLAVMINCTNNKNEESIPVKQDLTQQKKQKIVIYQVFTRLFGNENTTNKPWGTIEENGVGKFNDFTDKALQEIKALGVTHIWYTGILHHDVIRNYTEYGISNDDPDIVKGRAGSPYAVKDYYNVNPDLAKNPAKRLEEFKALIERSHNAGLKVLIDIVPNHVARNYQSLTKPDGVEDFGATDDKTVDYHVNNNFYYVPNEAFQVPVWENGYEPLGGEKNSLSDRKFDEFPAKWTGNGSRLTQPKMNDWYETVKVNYGVKPDGTKDFDALPDGYENEGYKKHFEFWSDKTVPSSWIKFRDIALYWTEMGVDGFRYDMSEMVPVEFWSYMNSSIKMKNESAFLLGEIYTPAIYRDYIKKGKIDYLYDKVALYDTIKHVMQGHGLTDNLPQIQKDLEDIEHNMIHFLENHDEQRIASPGFAGSAEKGKPAMVVSSTISSSPTLVYFGQEVGEPGNENAGFGRPTRTSIFDYIGVPHHQRWMNNKQFDGGQLSKKEIELRNFYKRLLNFTINSEALMGAYEEVHTYNRKNSNNYNHRVFSFVRWSDNEKLIIISNFDSDKSYEFDLKLPEDVISAWNLKDGKYQVTDQLYLKLTSDLKVENGIGNTNIKLAPLESLILKIK